MPGLPKLFTLYKRNDAKPLKLSLETNSIRVSKFIYCISLLSVSIDIPIYFKFWDGIFPDLVANYAAGYFLKIALQLQFLLFIQLLIAIDRDIDSNASA